MAVVVTTYIYHRKYLRNILRRLIRVSKKGLCKSKVVSIVAFALPIFFMN